ncbi:FmdB family zinc ribbon protein [Rhodocaloribacter sp.]
MPTYVYRREDGTTFEIQQRITEPALEKCPTTGQKVKRLITGGAGLIFKGSGFYLTDYARKNGNGSTKKETKTTSSASSEGSTKADKTAAKPETKASE